MSKRPVYLYCFSQREVPRLKIGISKHPKTRRAQVEYETKLETQIDWTKRYPSRTAARVVEIATHRHFKKHRRRGEYFHGITYRDVKRYINGPPIWWPVMLSVTALTFC